MMRPIRRRSEAGFTLLELMVALVAGLIAIAATYYVGSASQKHFSEQQRIAQTQMSVRMASMQLARDLGRAGFMSSPNSTRANTCFPPPRQVQAIRYTEGTDQAVLPNSANNGVSADRLILTGNYATSDLYYVRQLNGQALTLQEKWQSYRRDFTQSPSATNVNPARDEARFADVFKPGRMLKIVSHQGFEFFVDIAAVNGATGTITIAQNMGIGGPCLGGLMTGATVAPISMIQYRVVDPAAAGLTALTAGTNAAVETATGGTNAVLVREELNMITGAVMPGTTRIVMEYVADFDVSFVFDTSGPGMAPNLVREVDTQAETRLAPTATPEQVRSVIFRLSARTRREDPNFLNPDPTTPRDPATPLTRFDVNPNVDGAARVRTIQREVVLTNVVAGARRNG